ncbi:MAG: hypothetical protein PUD91_05930 [Bacteroidales bacterium]|nr:hypothetical protein [Bacteroidales bacterium]
MNDIAGDISRLLADPSAPVSREWMEEAWREQPYFLLPLMLYLQRNTPDAEERSRLLGRLATLAPDRVALFDALGEDASQFAGFYPPDEQEAKPDTETTISSFLNRFGNDDASEIAVLNQMIFNPVPDYSTLLAAEEESSTPSEEEISGEGVSDSDAMINRFIAQSKEKMGHFPTTVVDNPVSATAEPEPLPSDPIKRPNKADDSTFSESLAKIYIKQGKYSKALEIIKNINLKFPEKSIYFADQIRFLRKLVINEQIKNNK